MSRQPDIVVCPRCGGQMETEATTVGKVGNKYSQCGSCGWWQNIYYGTCRMTRMVLDHQLNFDNEDGWPCR